LPYFTIARNCRISPSQLPYFTIAIAVFHHRTQLPYFTIAAAVFHHRTQLLYFTIARNCRISPSHAIAVFHRARSCSIARSRRHASLQPHPPYLLDDALKVDALSQTSYSFPSLRYLCPPRSRSP
jgi:hypothetical protein